MKAILGKKVGMTKIFEANGKATSVTVVDVSNTVISKHLKSGETVTHIELGKDKKKNARKVDLGNYKTLDFVPRFKRVFKLDSNTEASEVGTELKASVFTIGDVVEVTAISKGKGFQGVMKRWGFKGTKRTHGQSDRMRAPGSIGSGTTPGRVIKGKKMPGRMGRDQKTIKNLRIVEVLEEDGLIAVSGSLPGYNGSYLIIKTK